MAGSAASRRSFFDLHCHTSYSFDSLARPRDQVRAAALRGLTHLAITDHDRIDGALEARDLAPEGLTVIVGEEVKTADGDLICLFLERPLAPGRPGASGRSRKRQIRSPSAVFTSSPTITVRPSGARSRASSAPSIRSWSVIARWVRPRSAAARTWSRGRASESKL